MKNTKLRKVFSAVALAFSLALTGCGGSGGGSGSGNFVDPQSANGYYDSSKSNVNNLVSSNTTFSAYNGTNANTVRLPVSVGQDVLYACLITNPNGVGRNITNLSFTPPCATNIRASVDESENVAASPSFCIGPNDFRENLSAKLMLQKELLNIYNAQKNNSVRCSSVSLHKDEYEYEGQTGIQVNVLGKKRSCTLVRISEHAKFFLDENNDGAVQKGSISDKYLNEFVKEFENYIYPVMSEYYGDGTELFWSDVDNDKKLSIVFSPVVNNYQSGSVVGIFDTSSINSSNPRDMVSLAVKNDGVAFDKWFMDARETIAHEMQHIINFSAKGNHSETETWIDEGLSVCAEILYRIRRADAGLYTYSLYFNGEHLDFAGNDARFYCYAYLNPELAVKDFSSGDTTALAHYGQKGLFFFYLLEQYGKTAFNRFCRSKAGFEKFNEFTGTDGRTLEQLILDFNFATLTEKMRNVEFTEFSKNPYAMVSSRHKFITNMNLNYVKTTNSGSYIEMTESLFTFINLSGKNAIKLIPQGGLNYLSGNGGTARYLLLQPKEMRSALAGELSFPITISANQPFVVNMLRMTD